MAVFWTSKRTLLNTELGRDTHNWFQCKPAPQTTTSVPKELKYPPNWEISQPQTSTVPKPRHPDLLVCALTIPSPSALTPTPAVLDQGLVLSNCPLRTAVPGEGKRRRVFYLPPTICDWLGLHIRFVSFSPWGVCRGTRHPSKSSCKKYLCSLGQHWDGIGCEAGNAHVLHLTVLAHRVYSQTCAHDTSSGKPSETSLSVDFCYFFSIGDLSYSLMWLLNYFSPSLSSMREQCVSIWVP